MCRCVRCSQIHSRETHLDKLDNHSWMLPTPWLTQYKIQIIKAFQKAVWSWSAGHWLDIAKMNACLKASFKFKFLKFMWNQMLQNDFVLIKAFLNGQGATEGASAKDQAKGQVFGLRRVSFLLGNWSQSPRVKISPMAERWFPIS